MNDWQRQSSAEGAALGVVRAVVSWFAGLDAMAVVFGTCLLTCAGAFLILQMRSSAPARPEPGPSVFGQIEPAEGERAAQGPRAAEPSSLEFAPRMPPRPEPLPEPSAQPDPQPPMPQPAAQPVLPQLPAIAAPPKAGPSLAQMKAAQSSGGSNGVASGARVGAPAAAAPDGKPGSAPGSKAGAIGGERSSAHAAAEEHSDLVRQMIPLVQAFLGNGIASGYNSGGSQRAYAVEQFGKIVQERNLYISTSTIVTTKSAQSLAEGLGVIVPKSQFGNR